MKKVKTVVVEMVSGRVNNKIRQSIDGVLERIVVGCSAAAMCPKRSMGRCIENSQGAPGRHEDEPSSGPGDASDLALCCVAGGRPSPA